MAGAAVSIRNVSRRFGEGETAIWAVREVSLEIEPGEFLALIGRSGSGKTTLLNLIAGLDKPSEGDVQIDGASVPAMSEKELIGLRRHTLGFVFQSFGLLPLLSAAENVELPLRIAGMGFRDRSRRVREVLEMVGLGRRSEHRPYELSGGEQQRVAIARALATSPRLILADEPTGELDSNTAMTIFTLMRDLAKDVGLTVITSTHDRLVIEMAGRVEELANGRHITDGVLYQTVTGRERSPFAAPALASPGAAITATKPDLWSPASAAPAPRPAAPVSSAPEQQASKPVPAPPPAPAAPAPEPTHAASSPAAVSSRSPLEVERVPAKEPPPTTEEQASEEDDSVMRWAPPSRR